MPDNFLHDRLANLGQNGDNMTEVEQRQKLNALVKRARARFYAAELALDQAMRDCTAACAGKPTDEWGGELASYDARVSLYLAAAERLPAGAKG